MSFLLDTNAWLRALVRPNELNERAHAILSDAANLPLGLSAISVWEVCTKFRKRPHELALRLPLDQWLPTALLPVLIRVIPIDVAIARLSNELPGELHEDPADRMIVATAIRTGEVILTSDEKILRYAHVSSLDTR